VSASRDLARAGVVVSGAFLTSRILGWLRIVVITNVYPTGPELDAFFAAFRIPDLMFQLVAAGALSSALIPIISGLFATDEHARAWRVVSTVANLVLIGLLVLGVVVLVAAPVIIPIITPGFTQAQWDETVELTRIMVLSPIFLALGAVATSVLNSSGRFAAAAVAPIVYNLAIIGAALILGRSMGVTGLAIGVVAGALGSFLVQLRPMHRLGFRYTPRIDLDDRQSRKALVLMAPRAVGLGASQITFLVVTSLASTLGTGAITSLTVAFTLLQIPIGIIGVPLGVVVFPSLSREAAVGRDVEYVELLTRALRLLVYVMIPIGALLAILSQQTVDFLFDWNGRYDAAALVMTADALVFFLIGLAAHSLIAVLARAFYARQDTLTPVLAAVAAVVINTTLAIILVGPMGLDGIALAIAIAAWVEAVALVVILERRIRLFRSAGLVRVGAEALAGTLLASFLGYGALLLSQFLLGTDPTTLGLVLQIAVTSAVFGAGYLAASLVLRIPELPSIVGVMVDVLRRPRRT
jgi:putative peptidoglycan lipid II flippase